ncbi:MAG: SUMF1/EgtB/PvdO family nonheme iron enzyme [Alphaproteobacteria bacterium]|nr:SUMF1/EgtB/PvdO family nonheme iron enzyme [Alphaproteobacteria bacterium]
MRVLAWILLVGSCDMAPGKAGVDTDRDDTAGDVDTTLGDSGDTGATVDSGDSGDSGPPGNGAVNHAPEVGAPALSPATATNDVLLGCTAVVTDPDGDPVTTTIRWEAGGEVIGIGSSLQLSPALALPGDEVRCVVVATDPHQAEASALASLVVQNRPPLAPRALRSTPGWLVLGQPARCDAQVDALDVDGEPVEVALSWVPIDPSVTSPVPRPGADLPPRAAPATQTGWRCVATATDASGAQAVSSLDVRAAPARPGTLEAFEAAVGSGPSLDLRYVPAGTEVVGCLPGRDDAGAPCAADLAPFVGTRTRGTWVAATELTEEVSTGLGLAPSVPSPTGPMPRTGLTWWEALAAANLLSERHGLPTCYALSGCSGAMGEGRVCTSVGVTADDGDPLACAGYRLPTQVEWEAAARAGMAGAPGGLDDLGGAVAEWTWDGAGPRPVEPEVDPLGPVDGVVGAARGGVGAPESAVRLLGRELLATTARRSDVGVRFVRSHPEPAGNGAPLVVAPVVAEEAPRGALSCTPAASPEDPDDDEVRTLTVWTRGDGSPYLGAAGAQPALVPAGVSSLGEDWICTTWAWDGVGGSAARGRGLTTTAEPPDPLDHPVLGRLVYVDRTRFTMGCQVPRDGASCPADRVATPVTLSHALWVMETELLQGSLEALQVLDPSAHTGAARPVTGLTWWEAAHVANELSAREGLETCYALSGCTGEVGTGRTCAGVSVRTASGSPSDCQGYRLPTGAEFERLARGTDPGGAPGGGDPTAVAWFAGNSGAQDGPREACLKPRNGLGLCDVSGNASEWVWDLDGSYAGAATTDPVGAASGTTRQSRGGSWKDAADGLAYAAVVRTSPAARIVDALGVRFVRNADVPGPATGDPTADPSVDDVSITPLLPYNDRELTCRATVSGADVVTTVSWFNRRTASVVGSGDRLRLSPGIARPGDVIVCSVRIPDPAGGLHIGSASVTIGNRPPPTPTNVRILPGIVQRGDDVRCIADELPAVDVDGEAVSVAVTWEGWGGGDEDLYLARTEQGEVLPGELLYAALFWNCRITASDASGSVEDGEAHLYLPPPYFAPGSTAAGDYRVGPLDWFSLLLVPADPFTAGCAVPRDADAPEGCEPDEVPPRTVFPKRAFYLQRTEMPETTWAGMGLPVASPDDALPIRGVTWWDALEAANRASLLAGMPPCYALSACTGTVGAGRVCEGVVVDAPGGDPRACTGFRLPTSTEWELAARARVSARWPHGDTPPHADSFGQPLDAGPTTIWRNARPIREFTQHLHGLSGNVAEWVWDVYDADPTTGEDTDPLGPSDGALRVIRGGSWTRTIDQVRSASRAGLAPDTRSPEVGFRLALTYRGLHEWVLPAPRPLEVDVVPADGSVRCTDTGPRHPADADLRLAWVRDGVPTGHESRGPSVSVPAAELDAGGSWVCRGYTSLGTGEVVVSEAVYEGG